MSPPSERVRGTPAAAVIPVRPLLSSSVFYCRVHPPSTADGPPASRGTNAWRRPLGHIQFCAMKYPNLRT